MREFAGDAGSWASRYFKTTRQKYSAEKWEVNSFSRSFLKVVWVAYYPSARLSQINLSQQLLKSRFGTNWVESRIDSQVS